jgi:hypothetical protein
MKLRQLNAAGIERLEAFLDSLTTDTPLPKSDELLTSPLTSEPFPITKDIYGVDFASRLEAAKYFDHLLGSCPQELVLRNRGLWSWLALLFFDQLCPRTADGRWRPRDRARWILQADDYRKYYRHLLAGPYGIYRAHRNNAAVAEGVLCTPLNSPGEIAEQLASRQELVTNPSVMAVATNLYLDPNSRRPKRGAGGKGPGSPRRLAAFLDQIDLTFYLQAITPELLLEKLPKEFDRFRALPTKGKTATSPSSAVAELPSG